ncbi:hypothetical protein M2244_003496 [Rhodoferax antarcticus]|uniref:Uncharacterized protein n=1 Tax=Rhodoferax antarcticus ANT.BR TaxID=1111071 RepID=A0A1Q8YJ06_9BURK|nr:hypothetical protein [Rhodoferax antarcticus]OLP07975.1 hypothetical protein BLL52_1073 [Rhodoferax antarcticus ANT.BR]
MATLLGIKLMRQQRHVVGKMAGVPAMDHRAAWQTLRA